MAVKEKEVEGEGEVECSVGEMIMLGTSEEVRKDKCIMCWLSSIFASTAQSNPIQSNQIK